MGFCLGTKYRYFSNTPGLNAAAATFLAFVRPPLLFAQTQRDPTENFEPGIAVMGFSSFSGMPWFVRCCFPSS